jgi:hypothetical protein
VEVDDLILAPEGVNLLYIHPVYKPQLYSVHCIIEFQHPAPEAEKGINKKDKILK